MTFWVCYVYASHAKIKARFQIVNQIEDYVERDWGIKGHKDVPDIRDNAFGGRRRLLQLKTHFLEKWIFYVYWFIAFILTAWRVCYKYHICMTLAMASLLPVWIMWICLVIAIRYGGRIKRGDKRLEYLRNSQQTQKTSDSNHYRTCLPLFWQNPKIEIQCLCGFFQSQ